MFDKIYSGLMKLICESEYEVKSGDTMQKIAKANGLALDQLKAMNPQITDADKLSIGQKVKTSLEYTVKSGDTVGALAKAYNTTVDKIKAANPDIEDIDRISVGQTLNMPAPSSAPAAPSKKPEKAAVKQQKKQRAQKKARPEKPHPDAKNPLEVDGGAISISKIQKKFDEEDKFVGRVIYSQTSSIASDAQFRMICKIILNRIKNKGYNMGRLTTPYQVVKQPGQFSCIQDPKNKNWWKFKPMLNKLTLRACVCAQILAGKVSGDLKLPDTDACAYHDNSITMPDDWKNNPFWKYIVVPVKGATHYTFYRIEPK